MNLDSLFSSLFIIYPQNSNIIQKLVKTLAFKISMENYLNTAIYRPFFAKLS